MIALRMELRHDAELRDSVWLVLQLHDEIILELPSRLLPRVAALVRRVLENIIPGRSLPFTTNIKIGRQGLADMETMQNPVDEQHPARDSADAASASASSSSSQLDKQQLAFTEFVA